MSGQYIRYPGNTSTIAVLSGIFNVKTYGAVGDGTTDDTAAIQSAVAAVAAAGGGELFFPAGTYLVNGDVSTGQRDSDGGGALVVPSNTVVRLVAGAVLKGYTSSSPNYKLIAIPSTSSNVTITGGGVIQGDRATHVYAGGGTHEWGYGIAITGAANVRILGTTVKDCTGDGISIHDNSLVAPKDIIVHGVLSTNNRRQGMSVVSADGLSVSDSIFELTNGTAPQYGVDVEPGGFSHQVSNVEFTNCIFRQNSGRGFGAISSTGTDIARLSVTGCQSIDNTGEGFCFDSVTTSPSLRACISAGNGTHGVYVINGSGAQVTGNTIFGNSQTTDATSQGMLLQTTTAALVANNTVRHGGGAKQHQYGISLNTTTRVVVSGNDLEASGRTGDISNFTPTGNAIVANKTNAGAVTLAGALGAPSSTSTAPNVSAKGSTPNARTYVYSLVGDGDVATQDGAMTLGSGNPASEAYLMYRGGTIKTGSAGSGVSGHRLQRGTAGAGFEDLLKIDDYLTSSKPVIRPRVDITYSASMTPDLKSGNVQRIVATNGTAFTVNNPTNGVHGAQLVLLVANSGVAQLGAVTWGSAFKLSSAWVQPPTGVTWSVTFEYDANNTIWVEVARSSFPATTVYNVLAFGAKGDGSTDNATAFSNVAAAANATSGAAVYFPEGTYLYTGGLVFTSPVTLMGPQGAVLNYSGSAQAVKFGPDGLDVTTYHTDPYQVVGLTFTGGASMTHGLYFNAWLVNTVVRGTYFYNFGVSTAWNIFYQAQNWYNVVDGIHMSANAGFARAFNGIRNNGYQTDGTTSDNGQSRTIITNSFLSPFSTEGGTGIYLNCFHGVISQTTVQNFATAIQLASWANNAVLDHVYIEQNTGALPAIMYGDLTGTRTGNFVAGVTVRDCYINVHNLDTAATCAPIGPATGSTGMSQWQVIGNRFNSRTALAPFVVQNNSASQANNYAAANQYVAANVFTPVPATTFPLHTAGASISDWDGSDETLTVYRDLTVLRGLSVAGPLGGTGTTVARFATGADTQNVVVLKAGLTTQQYTTLQFQDKDGNVTGVVEASGSALSNRLSLMGPGSNLGIQIQSNGVIEAKAAVIETIVAPTYGTTVTPSARLGNQFVITVTNGTGFTVAAPTGTNTGQRIVMTIKNASGGAVGTITWNTVFKMAAWTSPANGFSRSIEFRFDGTNWIEISRGAADIPN